MRGAHTEHSQIDHLAAVWKLSGYKSPSKAQQQCIISAQAKLFFLPPGFFGELGQQTSVVVTCLTFLRCSFPKGHQRSTQQVVKLTTYCALQCHQNYKSRLINRLFFSLFFSRHDFGGRVSLLTSSLYVSCQNSSEIYVPRRR